MHVLDCTILTTEADIADILQHLKPQIKMKIWNVYFFQFPGLSNAIFFTVSEEINLGNLYGGYGPAGGECEWGI